MASNSIVYLIPSSLQATSVTTIPAYILDAVKNCEVFFVEDERSARRYLKLLWKEMVIDQYTWVVIEAAAVLPFKKYVREGKKMGIISEAGCPGVADPGQNLVSVAHEEGASVRPLVGPNSMILALMASGLNGQQFRFTGYLPIDSLERMKAIRELEAESANKNCTEIFMETPYRNNQLLESLLKTCKPNTRLCIAADITTPTEYIQTHTVGEWKKIMPDLHKRPAIFCLLAV
jgi:16S rRNA (cytidine1402-2'-O)-methyltransferase